jgi:hypothetical protein
VADIERCEACEEPVRDLGFIVDPEEGVSICHRCAYEMTAGELQSVRQQLEGAVDLLREIGAMAGAKANGADARAMAKRAREFVASLDQPGGR